jgi:organic hydroperoxide reductase OsmC/OhrA
MPTHHYTAHIRWTGNSDAGTRDYRAYSRNHEISAAGKPVVPGSSDPAFRGDPGRYNPEELLVVSLSQCHMLWYLHLCTNEGVVVTAYEDSPVGVMVEHDDGSGEFTEVTLRPRVTVSDASMQEAARVLHGEVHRFCFIARSVKFPVHHEPVILVG